MHPSQRLTEEALLGFEPLLDTANHALHAEQPELAIQIHLLAQLEKILETLQKIERRLPEIPERDQR